MRLKSPLSDAAEAAMTRVIGCAIAVHRDLGPGFLESIYKKAMCIALTDADIAFECEKVIDVIYSGIAIPGQRVDLIVEGVIIVELKSVKRLQEIHEAQVLSYLKTTGLRGGLLVNFRVPVLRQGLKRIVL
jgi:GxxExxY protein